MKYSSKTDIELNMLAVLHGKRSDRKLKLSEYTSQCVLRGEVHEFLVATEWDNNRDAILNDISYLGFMEFKHSGVLEAGDTLMDKNGNVVGEIIGFDFTHMPNHINIILCSSSNKTGTERGFSASEKFMIKGYGSTPKELE